MRKILPALCLASLTSAAGGCSEPLDDAPAVESSQFALNGDLVVYNGTCTPAEADRLRQALALLRYWVVDQPATMQRCVEESILAGPETDLNLSADGDGYPEWIMWKLAEQMPTVVECREQQPAAEFNIPVEHVIEASWIIAGPVEELAKSLLHEIAHNKGFDHPDGGEYFHSIPLALGNCLGGAIAGDALPVDIIRRSEMTHEARLAGVGIRKGQPAESSCAGGRFAVAIYGHKNSDAVQRLGLACKMLGSHKSPQDEQAFGSATGTAFRQSCMPGEVMVGAWGRADRELRAVGPMCAPPTATGQFLDPVHGGAGHLTWKRRCPVGMAVKGMRVRTAGWGTGRVRWLELDCQSLDRPQPVSRWQLMELGGDSGHGHGNREECAGRSAMVALYPFVSSDETLVRLSGACRQIGSGGGQNWLSGAWHHLPGYGGARQGRDGDVWTLDQCSSGHALVGVRINHDSQIRAVQGICAPVTEWTAGQVVSIYYLPQRGAAQPTGTWTEQICPQRMLANGFYMDTSERVNSLAVHCRGFSGESGHPR